MGNRNSILARFAALIALTLAPFWCGMPGLSLMHSSAMAAPVHAGEACTGHGCHGAHDLASACGCTDAADLVTVPRVKAPAELPVHPWAATVPIVDHTPKPRETRHLTGLSPGPPLVHIDRTLVSLKVLLLN